MMIHPLRLIGVAAVVLAIGAAAPLAPAAIDLMTISPDAMHTFTMTVSGESRIYKVKRIR